MKVNWKIAFVYSNNKSTRKRSISLHRERLFIKAKNDLERPILRQQLPRRFINNRTIFFFSLFFLFLSSFAVCILKSYANPFFVLGYSQTCVFHVVMSSYIYIKKKANMKATGFVFEFEQL